MAQSSCQVGTQPLPPALKKRADRAYLLRGQLVVGVGLLSFLVLIAFTDSDSGAFQFDTSNFAWAAALGVLFVALMVWTGRRELKANPPTHGYVLYALPAEQRKQALNDVTRGEPACDALRRTLEVQYAQYLVRAGRNARFRVGYLLGMAALLSIPAHGLRRYAFLIVFLGAALFQLVHLARCGKGERFLEAAGRIEGNGQISELNTFFE